MKLIRLVVVVFLCAGLMSCATASLQDNATEADRRAALCLDAKTGYAMAERALALLPDLTEEAKLYWTVFAVGSRTAISAYCGETP